MNLKDQENLFKELCNLYNKTKATPEPFTFWTTNTAGKGIFNQGSKYLNVGIVKITSMSMLQLVGFHFTPDAFDNVILYIVNRKDDADIKVIKKLSVDIGKPMSDNNIITFLQDISNKFSSWKYITTAIDNNLINELENKYNEFFKYVKDYDINNITCFYDIFKIDTKKCEDKINQANKKIASNKDIHEVEEEQKKVTSEGEEPGKEKEEKKSTPLNYHPLNLILYGPPGTGKTYNTLFHALAIIEGKEVKDIENECKELDKLHNDDPKTNPDDGYKKIKEKYHYDDLVKNGQIVFTTFHQSMSYEDFIEGIKPDVSGPTMTYKVKDGIFKKMCELNAFLKNAKDKGIKFILDGGGEFIVDKIDGKTIHCRDSKKEETVIENIDDLITELEERLMAKPKQESEPELNQDQNPNINPNLGPIRKHPNDEKRHIYPYRKVIIDRFLEKKVLIIDEINRGNVAQIFGELITLIEDSKRLGNSESMTATLPYSQDKFGVPNNLYIIGTMNTADRSVEALDTALRRRFSFEEMMPNSDLLKDQTACGINLKELLDTINRRIELLKDREHKIGHSYFMGSEKEPNKEEWLKNVFKDKIIPLLQEYFYGDYKKIYYVLGPGFVENENKTADEIRNESFPYVSKDLDFDFEIPEEKYEIKSWDKIDIIDALEKLKGKKKEEAVIPLEPDKDSK